MKKIQTVLVVMIIAMTALFAFRSKKDGGSIKGSVYPADGASAVKAVSDENTFKAAVISGNFTFNDLKKGTYTLQVEVTSPYKPMTIPGVQVSDGNVTDVGVVKLSGQPK